MSSHIKHFLSQVLGSDKTWQKKLLTQWPTIIGPLKEKIILEKVESDTVILGVFHPAWIQELSFLKPVLLQTINDHLEQPYIKHIKIKTSRPPKKILGHTSLTPQKIMPTYILSVSENRALDKIKDPELKKALSLFLQRCTNLQ